jgi:hypothetical protein
MFNSRKRSEQPFQSLPLLHQLLRISLVLQHAVLHYLPRIRACPSTRGRPVNVGDSLVEALPHSLGLPRHHVSACKIIHRRLAVRKYFLLDDPVASRQSTFASLNQRRDRSLFCLVNNFAAKKHGNLPRPRLASAPPTTIYCGNLEGGACLSF